MLLQNTQDNSILRVKTINLVSFMLKVVLKSN